MSSSSSCRSKTSERVTRGKVSGSRASPNSTNVKRFTKLGTETTLVPNRVDGPETVKRESTSTNRSGSSRGAKPRKGVGKRPMQLEQEIAAKLQEYRMTDLYIQGRDHRYANMDGVNRFNNWVRDNMAQIHPSAQKFCEHCGVDYVLCEHCVIETPEAQVVVPLRQAHIAWSWNPVKTIVDMFKAPHFDMHQQNNQYLAGFSNELIPDRELVPELYNFITCNMQTCYMVSGRDDRALRVAHCHRLGMRWIDRERLTNELEADTLYKNRVLFTVQRACDNAENSMLYSYTSPHANFGLAWLPTSRMVRFLMLMIFIIGCAKLGHFVWPAILPRLAAHVVSHYMATLRTVILTVLAGSGQLCLSAIFLLLELLGMFVAVMLGLVSPVWPWVESWVFLFWNLNLPF